MLWLIFLTAWTLLLITLFLDRYVIRTNNIIWRLICGFVLLLFLLTDVTCLVLIGVDK